MFSFLGEPTIVLAGVILAFVQVLAALPWLWAIDPKGFRSAATSGSSMAYVGGGVIAAGLGISFYMGYTNDNQNLMRFGRYGYGALLHLQLLIDFFLFLPYLVVLVWPKGGVVAFAAYREAYRQPMFWVIALLALLVTWFAVPFPYFTFGDDYKMVKLIGFDVVMLPAVLFGVMAASMSISEEIEGRTAVTLMSKPINRRQFLLGKFVGITLACLIMTMILAWNLNFALRAQREFDPINNNPDPSDPLAAVAADKVVDPMTVQAQRTVVPIFERPMPSAPGKAVARGIGLWFSDTVAHGFGCLLGFGQVMILIAIASALATRMTFIVNLVLCLMVYFLGHLAPVVVEVTKSSSGGVGVGLVGFLGKLFDVILPALEFFNMGPAIIREAPLDLWRFALYVFTVFGYSIIYTCIALLIGLLLFEDRDLA